MTPLDEILEAAGIPIEREQRVIVSRNDYSVVGEKKFSWSDRIDPACEHFQLVMPPNPGSIILADLLP